MFGNIKSGLQRGFYWVMMQIHFLLLNTNENRKRTKLTSIYFFLYFCVMCHKWGRFLTKNKKTFLFSSTKEMIEWRGLLTTRCFLFFKNSFDPLILTTLAWKQEYKCTRETEYILLVVHLDEKYEMINMDSI